MIVDTPKPDIRGSVHFKGLVLGGGTSDQDRCSMAPLLCAKTSAHANQLKTSCTEADRG